MADKPPPPKLGVLKEVIGWDRCRLFANTAYLAVLDEGFAPLGAAA